jgi:hypothetical protein
MEMNAIWNSKTHLQKMFFVFNHSLRIWLSNLKKKLFYELDFATVFKWIWIISCY